MGFLEPEEEFAGAAVAVGGIEAAREEFEVDVSHVVGFADGELGFGDAGLADLELPDFGFELAQADHEPLGADEGGDEGLVVGATGRVVAFGEGVEFGGVFAEDDEGFGVEAEFGGVAGGCGLAFGRRGAVRFGAVGAAGLLCFRVDITSPR